MGISAPLINFESGPHRNAMTPDTSSGCGRASFGPTIGFVLAMMAWAYNDLIYDIDIRRNKPILGLFTLTFLWQNPYFLHFWTSDTKETVPIALSSDISMNLRTKSVSITVGQTAFTLKHNVLHDNLSFNRL